MVSKCHGVSFYTFWAEESKALRVRAEISYWLFGMVRAWDIVFEIILHASHVKGRHSLTIVASHGSWSICETRLLI